MDNDVGGVEKISELSEYSLDSDAEKERRIEEIRAEAKRLSFDAPGEDIPNPNFDPETGEKLDDPEIKGKYIVYKMREVANRTMENELHLTSESKFGPQNGEPIPPRPLAKESWKTSSDKLGNRVTCFRRQIGGLVDEYETQGVPVPRFDSHTGEMMPRDSVRVLQLIRRQQETVSSRERDEDFEDVKLGLEILRAMKNMKSGQARGVA